MVSMSRNRSVSVRCNSSLTCNDDPRFLAISESGISKFINEIDQSHMLAQSHSSWNSRPGDLKPNYRDRVFRCYAYLVDSDRICVRANTMYNLVDLNTKMAERIVPLFVPEGHSNVHPKGKVDPKANVSSRKIFF